MITVGFTMHSTVYGIVMCPPEYVNGVTYRNRWGERGHNHHFQKKKLGAGVYASVM